MRPSIRLLLLPAFLALACSCGGGSKELILVRPDRPIDAEITDNLVRLFDDDSTVTLRQSEAALSGSEALVAVAEGRADLALISNDLPFRDDIATIMPLYSTVLHVVHLGTQLDGTITDVLRNASVYAGPEGSASRRVFERLTSAIDLDGESYRFESDRTADVDLAVVFAPISPERLADYPDVRLWSIGTTADIGAGGAIDAVVLLNPHFRSFVIPTGTYGSATPEPVVTIAVDKLIVTRESLDDSVVYDLIGEILRLRPALSTIHPGLFHGISEEFDVGRSRFVIHKGTQDFLQRSEPSFVERYSGVAEVLVTLMIAAISATLAGVRIFNRRRKNRIDRFYAAALDIRNAAGRPSNGLDRLEAAQKLRQLQDEAFALLVDEKLAADESFRIFITLCNDILRSLDSD